MGPQPLSIEEYRRRNGANKPAEEEPKIPKVKKPKRRGGRLVRLRRERANLLRAINTRPPPSWDRATEIWKRIDELELQMQQLAENKSINIK